MNHTLLGLMLVAVTAGAQVARADWNGYDDHDAVPVQPQGGRNCGPRPPYAPRGQTFQHGRYELQNVQTWVPDQQQQVWVEGQCSNSGRGRGRHPWRTNCSPGYYRTMWTAGHYETTQQWVWVSSQPQPRPYYGAYQGTAGIKVQGTNGSFSMTVY